MDMIITFNHWHNKSAIRSILIWKAFIVKPWINSSQEYPTTVSTIYGDTLVPPNALSPSCWGLLLFIFIAQLGNSSSQLSIVSGLGNFPHVFHSAPLPRLVPRVTFYLTIGIGRDSSTLFFFQPFPLLFLLCTLYASSQSTACDPLGRSSYFLLLFSWFRLSIVTVLSGRGTIPLLR